MINKSGKNIQKFIEPEYEERYFFLKPSKDFDSNCTKCYDFPVNTVLVIQAALSYDEQFMFLCKRSLKKATFSLEYP